MSGAENVSVYIPCYNPGPEFERCLGGVLRQSAAPGEIIIVDDGSPEPVAIPGSSRGPAEGRNVRILRHPRNRGLAAARNTALEAAAGELAAALDADVEPAPDWLERLLSSLNSGKAVGVGGRMTEFYQDTLGDRWRAVHMAQHWGDKAAVNPRFLYGANTLFIKKALLAAGGYRDDLKTNYEDMLLSQKLYERGETLLYEPSARCFHLRRDTDDSILRGFWKWFHAKAFIEGQFNSPGALLERVEKVAFGIYRHRYDLDKNAGRTELLRLDLLIPWVFCALDLFFAADLKGAPRPVFPSVELTEIIPSSLRGLCLSIIKPPGEGPRPDPSYTKRFACCLEKFNWRGDAAFAL
jgi:glycosyltransferase involved in cell wall biosynthesis